MARTAVRLVPYGPPARAALTEVIAGAKHNDPLAPVTVVVPSNYAGLALRRALAVSTLPGSSQPGLVNVRFMVLARVIELVGAPRLAARGRRPLTAPYRAEAVRAAVEANPGPFADVALLGSTERSLQSTFHDLSDLPTAALDALAGINHRSANASPSTVTSAFVPPTSTTSTTWRKPPPSRPPPGRQRSRTSAG